MGGKLKSQIPHTLTGMATKLPNANKIVLGSNCGDGASREWETDSNASAAGINLMNEDCKITDSVSSIERIIFVRSFYSNYIQFSPNHCYLSKKLLVKLIRIK